jgi:RNA polymerase sigma-70 factor (ECF subfamily)
MSTDHEANRDHSRSDEDVLAAVQARDDAALAELYDRYGRLAFGLAYRILGERGVAEDVVQEAFLAVWRRADSYRTDRGSVRGWLMSIVHNASIDRRRGRFKREQGDVALDELAFKLETDADETFATVAEGIVAEQVRRALTGLPEEQRQAIELAYFGGLTQQEIAVRTGTPLGTVKSRLRLGLHKLRGLLQDAVVEPESGPPDVAGGGSRASPV